MLKHPETLQDKVRRATFVWLNYLGVIIGGWGIHPNALTVLGCVATVAASLLIAVNPVAAGVGLLLALPLDALDGAVARVTGQTSKFGALLDATLDRVADAFLCLGVAAYFTTRNEMVWALMGYGALIFGFLVSYIRAKAGEVGVDVRVGVMDRLVRLAVLLVGLFIPAVLFIAITTIAVGSVLTCGMRLRYVWERLQDESQK